jgi:acylphosphatase
MLRARTFLIRGRVQGVGFRYFAQAAAAREGIDGYAMNLEDGRVEIAAEGDAEALERFERSIRQGPPGARVQDVYAIDDAPSGRKTGFHIR